MFRLSHLRGRHSLVRMMSPSASSPAMGLSPRSHDDANSRHSSTIRPQRPLQSGKHHHLSQSRCGHACDFKRAMQPWSAVADVAMIGGVNLHAGQRHRGFASSSGGGDGTVNDTGSKDEGISGSADSDTGREKTVSAKKNQNFVKGRTTLGRRRRERHGDENANADGNSPDGDKSNAGGARHDRHPWSPKRQLDRDRIEERMGEALQEPAGVIWKPEMDREMDASTAGLSPDVDDRGADDDLIDQARTFIPSVSFYVGDGRPRKRVLVLCTGGTLTMAPDPSQGGALAPVEGAISKYMEDMNELDEPEMPDYVLHEYAPFRDSSDLGPADWKTLANDIKSNYLHFDGFVILTGTDTMAYCASALAFMLENLGKPVVFTGSQIPLCEPYNDARRNLIMAMIFASRDSINEVTIFFHDRLLRACRSTKVNTHRLMAFDSPNIDPLATIGIAITENKHLVLPQPKGTLRVHTRMDTRLLTVRLVPGFDDEMIRQMINTNMESNNLKALVLQLYGTGNIPSVKQSFIQLLADAREKGILVIASTQCFTGGVMLGHYAVGKALEKAGVVSANDMTLEAIACKTSYLLGRTDLTDDQVATLMGYSLRGEVTPADALAPPPVTSAYRDVVGQPHPPI